MVLDVFFKVMQKLLPLTLYRYLAYILGNRRNYFTNQTYNNILSLYTSYLVEKKLDISNKTVLEIGGGGALLIGCGLLLFGAKKVILVDPAIKVKEILKIFPDKEIVMINTNLDYSIADKYRASVDFILSNQVLEHISDLKAIFEMFDIMLKPNGIMYHNVDLSDHTYHGIYSLLQSIKINIVNQDSKYLRYSDEIFNLINSKTKCFMNRKLLPYYLSLLDELEYQHSLENMQYFNGKIHPDVLDRNNNDKYASLLKVKAFSLFAYRIR